MALWRRRQFVQIIHLITNISSTWQLWDFWFAFWMHCMTVRFFWRNLHKMGVCTMSWNQVEAKGVDSVFSVMHSFCLFLVFRKKNSMTFKHFRAAFLTYFEVGEQWSWPSIESMIDPENSARSWFLRPCRIFLTEGGAVSKVTKKASRQFGPK